MAQGDHIVLPDGRRLSFSEYGNPGGPALFYFHGFPGSRLEAGLVAGVADELGARLIAVDRPGIGRSSFQPGRRIADWARDIRDLADFLKCDRFAVLGASGGSPYGLCCARFLGERVTRVGIAAGVSPLDIPGSEAGMLPLQKVGLRLVRNFPRLTSYWFALPAWLLARRPDLFLGQLADRVAPVDREWLMNPDIGGPLEVSLRESVRQGRRGLAHDLSLLVRPWGVELSEIPREVLLWHGDHDHVVPLEMGRRLAALLPQSRAMFAAGEGHFSLILGRAREMMAALLGRE